MFIIFNKDCLLFATKRHKIYIFKIFLLFFFITLSNQGVAHGDDFTEVSKEIVKLVKDSGLRVSMIMGAIVSSIVGLMSGSITKPAFAVAVVAAMAPLFINWVDEPILF